MGKLSRNKGANFERRIARWMNDLQLESTDWKRNVEETQQGNMGDVLDKTGTLRLVLQCKHMKRPSPLRALNEAQEAAITSKLEPEAGVAIIQEHNGTQAVVLHPKLFAALLKLADDTAYEWYLRTEELIWAHVNEVKSW